MHCGKISREILQCVCRTGIDAHLEQDVPLLARWALNRDCQFRFLLLLREDERRMPGARRGGEHELCGRLDLPVDAGKRVPLRAVGSAVDPAKGTVRSEIDLANRQRQAARVPPMSDVFGLGPRVEHKSARRVEKTGSRCGGRRES